MAGDTTAALAEFDRQAAELAADGLAEVAAEVMADAIGVAAAAAADAGAEADRRRVEAAAFCRKAAAEGCDGATQMLALAAGFDAAAAAAMGGGAAAGGAAAAASPEPASADAAVLSAAAYKVAHRTVVRRGAELDSKRCGQLLAGRVRARHRQHRQKEKDMIWGGERGWRQKTEMPTEMATEDRRESQLGHWPGTLAALHTVTIRPMLWRARATVRG